EAQGGEQQGWQNPQRNLDDDEIGPPHRDHQQRQPDMPPRHRGVHDDPSPPQLSASTEPLGIFRRHRWAATAPLILGSSPSVMATVKIRQNGIPSQFGTP